jgi:glycine betaine/proline transport system ATP-binding protein
VLKVRHVLQEPITASPDEAAEEVAARLADAEAAAGFVLDADRKLLGVVTHFDASEVGRRPVSELMRPQDLTLDADTLLEDAMETLGDAALPIAVLDEGGRLLGAVRPRDALRAMARQQVRTSDDQAIATTS